MRERYIENRLVGEAQKLGVFTSKFVSPSNKGVPDRVFIANGIVLFLELKAPGKAPSILQHKRMLDMEAHGACVRWADDLSKALAVISCMARTPLLFPTMVEKLERCREVRTV